jgi:hypothetical protein
MEQKNWDRTNVNQVITDGIRHNCVGLAFLLGEHVKSPPGESRIHTQNWIGIKSE